MDKNKIKEFWLKSAKAKHMMPLAAAQYDFRDLQALQSEYLGFLASVNTEKIESPKEAEIEVPWREVLMFLQNMFSQMDANESEPDHAEAMAFRKMAFDLIMQAMLKTYVKKDKSEEPKPETPTPNNTGLIN